MRSPTSSTALKGAAAALLPVALAGCGGEVPPAAEPRLVRYQQISASGEELKRSFSGVLRSADEPRLSFKVPGTIIERPVGVGDRVALGDLLAELDPTDYRLSLEDAAAGLRRARAEARNADAAFRRVRELYENGNASRTEYDAARTGAESAASAVVSAEKRHELAQRQLDYTQLRAPAAGAIASVEVEVGENVQAGQPVVMLVTTGRGLEVEITMPEGLIAQVHSGEAAVARFDAVPDTPLQGTVSEVGVAATGSGTLFPVTVRLEEEHPSLRAGMAAQVEFSFSTPDPSGRLLLPFHAVGEDREGRFVFVVEPTSEGRAVAHRRGVTLGELGSDGIVEVLSGVDHGDRVVTAGVGSLGDGETVRIEDAG